MTADVRDDVLAPAGVAIELSEIREPSEHRGDRALTVMVTIMQMLALVIAVVLVVNTVSALLSQQRRHVGVMKAVGATSGQLVAQYLGYVLVLAVAALVLAVPVSILIGRYLAGFLAGLANFRLEPLGVPWRTIAIQTVVALAVPVLAVSVVVRRAARLTVRETIVDRGILSTAGSGRVVLPLSRPARLACRNAVRNRSRLALTVSTVALCGAVVVGVFSTQIAMGRLTDQVSGYWDYDVELALSGPTDTAGAASVLGDDAEVALVEGWYRGQAFRIRPDGTENENISLTGVVVGSPSITPTVIDGRWLASGDENGIVINTHFADEEPDVSVGGTVTLDIEGRRRDWTVVGISSTTLVGPVAYVSSEELAAHVGRPGQANLLAMRLVDGTDPDVAAARLDALAREAGIPVAQVQTNAEVGAATEELIGLFTGLLLLVSAVLAVVAVVGVAGTMTLSVIEQTREVGVLRTLGASTWAVRRLLLVQGLAIAVVGAVSGVALSVPIAWALRSALESSLIDAPIPVGFSWFGVGIWIAVALLIGALGSTRPARVASRLTIRETLAYE
ncbi:MAG: FtsX-like permease family protein [Acidimicrobiales bacterium]